MERGTAAGGGGAFGPARKRIDMRRGRMVNLSLVGCLYEAGELGPLSCELWLLCLLCPRRGAEIELISGTAVFSTSNESDKGAGKVNSRKPPFPKREWGCCSSGSSDTGREELWTRDWRRRTKRECT